MMRIRVVVMPPVDKRIFRYDTNTLQENSTEHPHFAYKREMSLLEREMLKYITLLPSLIYSSGNMLLVI